MPDPLELLILKAERAKKHILDAEAAWDAFFDERKYPVSFKDDLNTEERSFYLSSIKEIPPDLSLIVGDAVHNLRSTLDHLAHRLVCVGQGSPGPFAYVYFPVAENATKYISGRDGKIHGMRNDAIKAIDALEPYGGGKGEALWHIQCLNNIDKHRMLLTVLANIDMHSMLPSQRAEAIGKYLGSYPGGTPPNLKGIFIAPTVKITFPLKAGDILLTIPKSEVEKDMKFFMHVAFGEPEVVKGKPVFKTLHESAALIRHIIFLFERLGLL